MSTSGGLARQRGACRASRKAPARTTEDAAVKSARPLEDGISPNPKMPHAALMRTHT